MTDIQETIRLINELYVLLWPVPVFGGLLGFYLALERRYKNTLYGLEVSDVASIAFIVAVCSVMWPVLVVSGILWALLDGIRLVFKGLTWLSNKWFGRKRSKPLQTDYD